MNVLITGGSGSIGKSIVDEYLKYGHQIFSPTSLELDLSSNKRIQEVINDTTII